MDQARRLIRALRLSERRHRQLLAASSEGYCRFDTGLVARDVNPALCAALARPRAAMIGRRLSEFLAQGQEEVIQARLGEIGKGDGDGDEVFALDFLTGDGRRVPTRTRLGVFAGAPGDGPADARRYALVRDVGELVRREEALAMAEARNRAIIETALDAILTIDVEGLIVAANPAVSRLFGYELEDLLGNGVEMLMEAGDAAQHAGHVRRYLTSGMRRVIGIGREVTARRRDGAVFPAWLSVSEITVPGFHGFVGMIRDVTPARKAQNALIAAKEAADLANRAKAAFLSAMSHELRTPLNAVLGFADLIRWQAGTDTAATLGHAEEIRRAGLHLLANVDDILEMATLEGGNLNFEETLFDVRDVVISCVRLIAKRAEGQRVTVETDIARELAPYQGDPRALKQVLLHLLSNAIKFTPEGGRVGVCARLGAQGELLVEIFDTGIGIAADRLESIFLPFIQCETALDRRFEGVGLGLSIAKSLIEQQGGRLDIRSVEGAGTSVVARLPAHRFVADW